MDCHAATEDIIELDTSTLNYDRFLCVNRYMIIDSNKIGTIEDIRPDIVLARIIPVESAPFKTHSIQGNWSDWSIGVKLYCSKSKLNVVEEGS